MCSDTRLMGTVQTNSPGKEEPNPDEGAGPFITSGMSMSVTLRKGL